MFTPLDDRVLLLLDAAPAETKKGSLYIPDVGNEAPQNATIIAIGSNCEFAIQPGDKVVLAKYGGHQVVLDGTSYVCLSETEILGKLG